MRWVLGGVVAALCVAAFFGGRATVDQRMPTAGTAFNAGYLAGREAAFGGFDGGWAYGAPYIVIVERAGSGVTYRIAHRMPMSAGTSYRLCGGSAVCSSPAR